MQREQTPKNSSPAQQLLSPNGDIDTPSINKRLYFSNQEFDNLTHYLFRYPAKFHPPMVRTLVEQYSKPGDLLLDPFCGSGTILVEAATLGRQCIGTDIDPLAVFASNVKTHRYNIGHLRANSNQLIDKLRKLERKAGEYETRQFVDVTEEDMWATIKAESLWVPTIPNLLHWFRKYVIIDLARILKIIKNINCPRTHTQFFRLCFASIIRNSSNADPVPVSGLEYTSHMRQKDREGRIINPFSLMYRALSRGVQATENYHNHTSSNLHTKARLVDVMRLSSSLRGYQPTVVITSPPYHNAVDYYRRHQLEMFWLAMTKTQQERVAIKHRYIGRPSVLVNDPLLDEDIQLPAKNEAMYREMQAESRQRANAFKNYSISIQKAANEIRSVLKQGSVVLFVVGNSTWNGQEIPTTELFIELTHNILSLQDTFWYPVKNRYMSYERHNGADIDKEYVLVFNSL